MIDIIKGDCLEVMRGLGAESVDAIVTDPPWGLKFMGKEWDHGVPGIPFWSAALRVAKPGAHLLAFGGTRTHHRLMCAIEDAGWRIRDCLMWLTGQGFPKSLDISKAIDREAGAEREVIGGPRGRNKCDGNPCRCAQNEILGRTVHPPNTTPATDSARRWQGWGTALKPAWEPIIMARKPLIGTVAANVERYGTGGINVDGCRIGTGKNIPASPSAHAATRVYGGGYGPEDGSASGFDPNIGRFPANLILDEDAAAMLDEQSGDLGIKGSPQLAGKFYLDGSRKVYGDRGGAPYNGGYTDSGGASRFFYVAKASRAEREDGVTGEPVRRTDGREKELEHPRLRTSSVKNHHPTVKPVSLMRWLVRLVTPSGGVILDPFCGSGTTGIAAAEGGFGFIGIEKDPAYYEIARVRISEAQRQGILDYRKGPNS